MSSNKKNLMMELLDNQLKNVNHLKKLSYNDIKRIIKNIDTTIFSNKCCIWKGYVANVDTNKSAYINFYFREKKLALHRLLYSNYIGPINDNEYIKFNCKNKGKCCTINHLIKYEKDIEEVVYDENNNVDNIVEREEVEEDTDIKDIKEINNKKNNKKNNSNIKKASDFTISFD